MRTAPDHPRRREAPFPGAAATREHRDAQRPSRPEYGDRDDAQDPRQLGAARDHVGPARAWISSSLACRTCWREAEQHGEELVWRRDRPGTGPSGDLHVR
jgi:hypothetical protein